MKIKKNTNKIVITALMTALVMVSTMSIKIPSPAGGYIHPGDAIIIISAIFLGPIYGSFAAGVGSMFADVFSGYTHFALATLIIKALACFLSSLVYQVLDKKFNKKTIPLISSGIVTSFIVIFGYLIFEAYILKLGIHVAIAASSFNIVQSLIGILISVLLFPLVKKYFASHLSS